MSGVRGQGRRFDVDAALEAATLEFWEHGYEATSLTALTRAMRINPPSLYKAFGNKEELFFRVVEHYTATRPFMSEAFDEETSALPLVRRLLLGAAEAYPRGPDPGGCLVISAAVTVGDANRQVGEHLARMRNENVAAIRRRVEADVAAGILRPTVDADATARFVGACIQGMSQQARDGADATSLRTVAEFAVRAVEAQCA